MTIALHPDVSADVQISVVRSMDEYEAKLRGEEAEEEKLDAAYEAAASCPEAEAAEGDEAADAEEA